MTSVVIQILTSHSSCGLKTSNKTCTVFEWRDILLTCSNAPFYIRQVFLPAWPSVTISLPSNFLWFHFFFCFLLNLLLNFRFLSSSSSLARQPYVGPGLPQMLLPAVVSGYCFFRFRDKSLFQGGVVCPTPNPRLSWRADVFSQGCLP
jgi:hypothetical protein